MSSASGAGTSQQPFGALEHPRTDNVWTFGDESDESCQKLPWVSEVTHLTLWCSLKSPALKVTGALSGEAPAGTSKFFPGQLGWHWTLGSYRIQMCFLSQLQKMLMYKTEFIALEEVSVTSWSFQILSDPFRIHFGSISALGSKKPSSVSGCSRRRSCSLGVEDKQHGATIYHKCHC